MEDWNKLTVNQLKTECTKRSLDTTGKKADLVQRLKQHDEEILEEELNGAEVEEAELLEGADEDEMEGEFDVDEEEQIEGDGGEEGGEGEDGEENAGEEAVVEGEEEEKAEQIEDEGAEQGEEEAAEQEEGVEQEEKEGEEEGAKQTDEKKGQEASENIDQLIDAIDSAMEEEGDSKKDKEEKDEKANLKKATSRPRVPVGKTVRIEFQEEQRVRTVVFGPLTLQDLKNEDMLEFLGQADQFFIRFATDSSTGHAQLRMKTFEDAKSLVELITENPFKEGLVIKQVGPKEGQNVDAILKGEAEKTQEKLDARVLYVHNIPESATEDALKQLMPEALSVCIPKDEKRKSKGYAYLEFEDSEKMEACYKSVATLTLGDHLITLHHIPSEQHKYTPRRPNQNAPTNQRRMDQRGQNQQRDRRNDRSPRGRPNYGGGGGNRNRGGNVRPLLGNQPRGNRGNQGGVPGVDAVNLLVNLSQMLSNQQQGGASSQSYGGGNQNYGGGNQNYGGGNRGIGNQEFRQGNYGRQGGSQDQWNRKRRANDGGIGYGKMARQDNYGRGYNQGGYRGGRRY